MMNTIAEILSNEWVNALGWTLLHSFWQALIILLLVLGSLNVIPSMRSGLRYGIACAGFLMFIVISATTFVQLISEAPESHSSVDSTFTQRFRQAPIQEINDRGEDGLIWFILSATERNIGWLVVAWTAGFFFFSLRLITGVWFTRKIRSASRLVEGPWQEFVAMSAKTLGITQLVRLAESAAITTPMVIGFLKPLILVPAGMLTGLTATQLETILLHELAHIKRNDFVINFLQAFFETIFFFNPFVWILSNEIRKEREHCCDDLVVKQHGDASAYAHALLQLAEFRLASPVLALPLSSDRNVLLQRIKRIMEKSFKRSGKSRMVISVMVMILGLISISWIADEKKNDNAAKKKPVLQDTIPDRKLNGARYSKKSIITIDENNVPHEEIIEEFEGDEDLKALMEKGFPSEFDRSVIPSPPDFSQHALHEFLPFQDTIPPFPIPCWDSLIQSFNEQFKQFDEFALRNQDLERLLEDMEKNFLSEEWHEWQTPFHPDFPDDLRFLPDSDAFKGLEEELNRFRDFQTESFMTFDHAFDSFKGRLDAPEQSLRDELIEDGYLSPNESINSLEWNDEHFKVNGKAVRPEDLKKYYEFRERLMGEAQMKKPE